MSNCIHSLTAQFLILKGVKPKFLNNSYARHRNECGVTYCIKPQPKPACNLHSVLALKRAFSLVELAIVLAIIGVLTGGGITIYEQVSNRSKIDETKRRMKVIIQAIDDYADANGSNVPETVAITTNVSDSNFGAPNASNNCPFAGTNRGMVPFYKLRIPYEYAFDAWGNRIRYICGVPNMLNEQGSTNYNGSNKTILAAVISAGPNQNRAFSGRRATRINNTLGTSDEITNMNDSSWAANFTASPPVGGFDDIVYFITLEQTARDFFEDK
jgi:prepilin-type N-terminal cleavage/methylation domain-containing protein